MPKQMDFNMKDWTNEEEFYASRPNLAGHYSVFLALPVSQQSRILNHIEMSKNKEKSL